MKEKVPVSGLHRDMPSVHYKFELARDERVALPGQESFSCHGELDPRRPSPFWRAFGARRRDVIAPQVITLEREPAEWSWHPRYRVPQKGAYPRRKRSCSFSRLIGMTTGSPGGSSHASSEPRSEMTDSAAPTIARPAPRILLMEDEPMVRKVLRTFLKGLGMIVFEATSVAEALELVQRENVDLCVLDYELRDGTAFDFLTKKSPELTIPAIILSGRGTIGLAVEAVKLGAEHFLTKPVDLESLQKLLELILERQARDRHLSASRLKSTVEEVNPFVGTSRAIAAVKQLAEAVVDSIAPVLILGETGTGKSVLARWLHEHGPRSSEPFVDLNCAGLSKELAEADLFGHQKGAFTGASAEKKGLLEVAHGGEVFLDEIGDLDLGVQPKLLKVLEETTFRRVGDIKNRPADVRIIAATHRDLLAMSQTGAFRHDLLFRINTVTFHLPSLRERTEDLLPLAERILWSLCRRSGRTPPTFSTRAKEVLENHDWPGNMRELRNSLERALLFCPGNVIETIAVSSDNGRSPAPPSSGHKLVSLADAERNLVGF